MKLLIAIHRWLGAQEAVESVPAVRVTTTKQFGTFLTNYHPIVEELAQRNAYESRHTHFDESTGFPLGPKNAADAVKEELAFIRRLHCTSIMQPADASSTFAATAPLGKPEVHAQLMHHGRPASTRRRECSVNLRHQSSAFSQPIASHCFHQSDS